MSTGSGWRQDYLARVRALHGSTVHTGPERNEDDALLVLLESLPASVLVAILMNSNWFACERAIRALATHRHQDARVTAYTQYRRAFEATFADNVLWQHWVTTCFPRVTRLPANETSWKTLARRIVALVCTTQIRLGNDTLANACFAPVVRWPSFRRAFAEATTCGRLFHALYNTGQPTDLATFLAPTNAYGSRRFFLVIGSEQYVSSYRPSQQLREVVVATNGRWEFIEFSAADGTHIQGFTGELFGRIASTMPPFFHMPPGRPSPPPVLTLQTWIEPHVFVSDRLFDTIAVHVAAAPSPPLQLPAELNTVLDQLFFRR